MEHKIKGQFWAIEAPQIKHFGEIRLDSTKGGFELTLYGGFAAFGPALNDFNFHQPIPYLYGWCEDNQFILLYGLRIIGATGSLGVYGKDSAFRVVFQLSFTSILRGKTNPSIQAKFMTIQFGAQHMATWADIRLTDSEAHKANQDGSFMSDPNDRIVYSLAGFKPVDIPFSSSTCSFSLYFDSKRSFTADEIHAKKKGKILIELTTSWDIDMLRSFIERFREFYSLLLGTQAGLEDIFVSDTEGNRYQFNYTDNRRNNAYSTSIYAENRILDIGEVVDNNALNSFYQNYDTFRLPLSYLQDYQISQKTNIIRFVQPFIAGCTALYNKLFKVDDEKQGEINRTLADILRMYPFSETQRNFLLKSRIAKPIRDIPSWQKLVRLIEVSQKLTGLIPNPTLFAKRLVDLRNYLVHEDDKPERDLTLLNDERRLRHSIVVLKIVMEYHILVLAGISKEIVENKIDRTMPNFVHFQRGKLKI